MQFGTNFNTNEILNLSVLSIKIIQYNTLNLCSALYQKYDKYMKST